MNAPKTVSELAEILRLHKLYLEGNADVLGDDATWCSRQSWRKHSADSRSVSKRAIDGERRVSGAGGMIAGLSRGAHDAV